MKNSKETKALVVEGKLKVTAGEWLEIQLPDGNRNAARAFMDRTDHWVLAWPWLLGEFFSLPRRVACRQKGV